MFLKNLTISNNDEIIRDIPFHKGINLIIDETKSENKTDSGNSVGKTTVLRLIDFCLDGKGENIFKDPEFKDSNLKIENFLKENNIIITLTLVEDLDNEKSEKIIIQRNFLSRKNKIQKINNKSFTDTDFSNELKKLIFKTEVEQPTFKQLKSKNIRDEKNKLVNTIRVLPQNVITDVTYEALHLFWFGIDVDNSKDKLVRDKNLETRLQSRLRKENNLPAINQSLIIINKEIEELLIKKNNFNLNDKFESDLSNLNKIKSEININSQEISRLELRKELIIESKKDLEKDFSNIDTQQIKRMYEKAKTFIPNIQKTFEETLTFHNEMIQQKILFITEEIPELERRMIQLRRDLKILLLNEAKLSEKLNKSGAVEDLQKIIDELNSYYEKKGNFEEQKKLWESSNKNLEILNNKIKSINENIYSKDQIIQDRIAEFNTYFSDISNRLDGAHSLLSAENMDGVYKFKISGFDNPGTGSKKSQMASFDLAYIKFADELNIPCLHFILQDQIENVHSNQITNLLTDIVNEVNCQYVLSVLKDKLPNDLNTNDYEILSLSQDNKLFKV
ncbi:MAG: DUF2326 domain-containing protein [Flavobacterium sp.]|uniref:DUF2326 domain-containing protein n=1 Tax=Flavobacterium sp. TaxID=239 RepID=UPI0011DBC28E|nr:MAG: DUF2326 domain-containing protein [Flavobacterium sp.]